MVDLALAGHAGAFPLTAEAKALILDYLAQARTSAGDDLDSDDVIRDIETAIGDQLQTILDNGGSVDSESAVQLLDRFGPVDTGPEDEATSDAPFLCRIEEGRQIAGLCLGLATRADVRVDWLRSIAVILGLLSGGLLVLAYLIALLFAPRMRTPEEYRRALRADRRRSRR